MNEHLAKINSTILERKTVVEKIAEKAKIADLNWRIVAEKPAANF